MYIELMVTECDITERQYNNPVKGAGIVARGATGRWCVVLWVGPEYLEEMDIKAIAPEEAREQLKKSHPLDTIDF